MQLFFGGAGEGPEGYRPHLLEDWPVDGDLVVPLEVFPDSLKDRMGDTWRLKQKNQGILTIRAGSRSTGCHIDSELAESGRWFLAIRGCELPGQLRPDRDVAEFDFSRPAVVVDHVLCRDTLHTCGEVAYPLGGYVLHVGIESQPVAAGLRARRRINRATSVRIPVCVVNF